MTINGSFTRPDHGPAAAAILFADGRLPTGGHAHSGGLEALVVLGEVTDLPTLARVALARLTTQGRVDAALTIAAARAWPAVSAMPAVSKRNHEMARLVAEYDARTLSPALRRASRTLGRHLIRVAGHMLDGDVHDQLRVAVADAPRPIVAGAAGAALGITGDHLARIECHHLVSSICGAGVKLLGLDPLAVVTIQRDLASTIDEIVDDIAELSATEPLAGVTSGRAEVLAEWHAAQPARLFAT